MFSSQLVPGDIIKIEDKMTIPADCILIRGQILVDESSLTGESLPIHKNELEK